MNEYNDKWTREKHIEYRKLKKSGYTDSMLVEHFGDDIYYSGMYNKNAHIIPFNYFIKCVENRLNEIRINPEHVDYSVIPTLSNFIKNKKDYVIYFESNNIPYVICLMYYPINNIDTYNIILTTKEQWVEYEFNLRSFIKNDKLSEKEHIILSDIISKETKLNDLFPIFRKLTWILLDFYSKHLKGQLLSIGDTYNKKKINLYRNIIKDSFSNISEQELIFNGHKYYIYKIE